jgi:hypothetical protein
MEPNKIYDIIIDISKPFEKYNTTNTKGQNITKAIIPILHNQEKKIWWLNTKNPTYKELLQEIRQGRTKFKVIQVGNQADTRYNIIREDIK